MANQPTPARPWFRLASIARPAAPTPTPTPAPAPAPAPAPEPRPPLVIRPIFRPLAPSQPTQPQEPTPPPPAAAPPASTVAPPPAAAVPRTFAAPTPTPAPAPAPSVTVRPIFATASVPSSPVQRVFTPAAPSSTVSQVPVVSQPQTKVSAPSSSVQTSPVAKAVPSSSSVRTSPIEKAAPTQTFPDVKAATTSYVTNASTTAPSQNTIKPAAQTPPQSPKPKPTAPPPSPLNLPPTRLKAETETEQKIPLEAEQKTVLVQKTIEKCKPWLGGNADSQWEHSEHCKPSHVHIGKQEGHKEVETKEKGSYKKLLDSEEAGTRIITIAGENKGAFMELIRSPKKQDGSNKSNSLQVKKGISTTGIQGSDSESYSSSDKEGNLKKDKSNKGNKGANSLPMNAFMNSNVQSINNSIVYNSSYNHHDPGVHLTLSRKGSGGFQAKERVNGDQD